MAAKKPNNRWIETYQFHGVRFNESNKTVIVHGEQASGDCVLCGKEEHFFLNVNSGQFDCKVCTASGNAYTFLKALHEKLLKETKRSHYNLLSEYRHGLPAEAFPAHDIAFDPAFGGRFLLPMRNDKGAYANLAAYAPKGQTNLLYTTGLAMHLWGIDQLKPSGPIYICEGPWDRIALYYLLEISGQPTDNITVLATPAAGTFKEEWVAFFKDREVILVYDNDDAGLKGMEKVVKMLSPVARKLQTIRWPSDIARFPKGFDVSDFVVKNLKSPKSAATTFQTFLAEQSSQPGKKRLVRENYSAVLKDFKKVLHIDKHWENAMAVVLSIVFSARLPGDPLWGFLVGPPGSGKTLMLQSLIGTPQYTQFLSKLTKSQLVSGYMSEEDPSVLAQLTNKALIVEDYTAIKSMPLGAQEELYGVLRCAYNGFYDQQFGNGQVRRYDNLHFSMVAGVTDIIHGDQRASLGERFLKIELLGPDHDSDNHVRAALEDDNDEERAEIMRFLRESVSAFLDRPFTQDQLPKVPEWFKERLVPLAQLVAHIRASVNRANGEMVYRPRAEIGSRLAKQLQKLARCLAFVHGKTKLDMDIYQIVQKVALDTALGWNLEIVNALFSFPEGTTTDVIGTRLQISPSSVYNKLSDLQELRIVYKADKVQKNLKGRKSDVWNLTPMMRDYWRDAKIDYDPPKLNFSSRKGYKPKKKKKFVPLIKTKKKVTV